MTSQIMKAAPPTFAKRVRIEWFGRVYVSIFPVMSLSYLKDRVAFLFHAGMGVTAVVAALKVFKVLVIGQPLKGSLY